MRDSLLGVVSVTGTAFEQRLLLRSGDRVTALELTASDSIALSALGGLEVLVAGEQGPQGFRVAEFTVMRLNGAHVADGVLQSEGGHLVLETKEGAHTLGNPPDALRGLVGARVWIAGSLDTGPNSFGVIKTKAR